MKNSFEYGFPARDEYSETNQQNQDCNWKLEVPDQPVVSRDAHRGRSLHAQSAALNDSKIRHLAAEESENRRRTSKREGPNDADYVSWTG